MSLYDIIFIGSEYMNNNLVVLQHFFEVDNRIKKEMYMNKPPSDNEFLDQESLHKYTDKLYDSLLYIFSELKCITKDLFGIESMAFKRIVDLESVIKNNFYSCGLDIDKLRLFYRKYISNMNSDFINMVKETCVGYYVYNSDKPLFMATTINEVLHFLHSYILNNEDILQSIPLVAKKGDARESVSLRGNASPLFQNIFDSYPEMSVGIADMVAINERKLLMMIRDRGHALTIEITINDDVAKLEYFIPKICNVDMVNALPGVHKVNSDDIGTTGMFETNIDNLPNALFNFILKVPTDDDMIIEKFNIQK